MQAYAGAIAEGIDFNLVSEASKIKGVKQQVGERDSKTISLSQAALVRKFYEEKGIYKKIVNYCNKSGTDYAAFGLSKKVVENDAKYKEILNEVKKAQK